MATHRKNGTARSILAGLAVGIQPPEARTYLTCLRAMMAKGMIEPTRKRGVWRITDAGLAEVQERSDRLSAKYALKTAGPQILDPAAEQR